MTAGTCEWMYLVTAGPSLRLFKKGSRVRPFPSHPSLFSCCQQQLFFFQTLSPHTGTEFDLFQLIPCFFFNSLHFPGVFPGNITMRDKRFQMHLLGRAKNLVLVDENTVLMRIEGWHNRI